MRSRIVKSLLIFIGLGSIGPSLRADVCAAFRPTRLDTRDVNLDRPIAALPGHFNGDGLLDVAVVNKYAPGTLLTGSVSVLVGRFDGQFNLSTTQTTTGGSHWAATADFNRDGNPDIAAVNDASVMIFLGDGGGGFLPHSTLSTGFDSVYVTATDMNADNNPDLVVVQQYVGQPNGRVVVLRGDGLGWFTSMTPAQVAQSPLSGATGDFNGDGKLDVVTASSLTGYVTFLPGLGNGNFGPGVNSPTGVSGSSFIAASDWNSDTLLDLAITSDDTGMSLVIMRGLGNGSFSVIGTKVTGFTPRNPVVCDFDHNGAADIAVPNQGSNDLSILYGDGGGNFTGPVNVGTDVGPSFAVLTDLNFDGYCDVVTANGANSVSVLVGGPKGTLGTPSINTGRAPLGSAAADFDRDGDLDMAVVNRDDGTISILRGDGEGGLVLAQTALVGEAPGSVAAADFNLDGAPDLVVADQGSPGDTTNDSLYVFYNDTLGGFTVGNILTVGDFPLDVKTGDLNADGRPDIVVANSRSDKVSFYFSLPGDEFSNVKNVRIGDPQRSLAMGDFNGDGLTDVAAGLMGQNTVTMLLATPQFSLEEGPSIILGGTSILDQVASGDLNGDQIPDLAVLSQSSDPFGDGTVTVLLGTGVGGDFTNPFPPVPTGAVPEAIVLLDLDRAGGLDVVVANRLQNDVMTFHGDGTGAMMPGERYGTGSDPIHLVTGDFNGDFRSDVAAVAFAGDDVEVLLNNSPIDDRITSLEFVDDMLFKWDPVPGADSYRVYSDYLSLLSAGNYGKCLGASLSVPQYADAAPVPAGEGYFYLVSVVSGGREGPLGYSSICVSEPNFSPCSGP
ncbi:MAG TPA: VCBS repeat-containing protein [Candidatus Polarisedimenticolia bacterium]|jgi:hypothetical protein